MSDKTGRGKQHLTVKQQLALDRVSEANDTYRLARKSVAKQVREQIEKELAAFERNHAEAVYLAVEAGVPKTRIAKEGMGTSATNLVYDIVAAHEARMALEMPTIANLTPRFSFARRSEANDTPYVLVLDGDAFVNPHWDEMLNMPEGEGYLFIRMYGKVSQLMQQAEADPAPEGMLEWVIENWEKVEA